MSFETSSLNKKEIPNEIMELIENSSLNPDEKIELVLIKAGFKPVTDITLYSESWVKESEENRKTVDSDKVRQFENLLENLGLVIKVNESEIDEFSRIEDEQPEREIVMQREKITITVGRDQATIEKFMQAVQHGNDEEMGELFEYPKTAIEAYLGKRESIKRQDLPAEIKEKDFYPFIQFGVLSKENWEKEIETAKLWASVVKRNSPKLFEEYTRYIRREVSDF